MNELTRAWTALMEKFKVPQERQTDRRTEREREPPRVEQVTQVGWWSEIDGAAASLGSARLEAGWQAQFQIPYERNKSTESEYYVQGMSPNVDNFYVK